MEVYNEVTCIRNMKRFIKKFFYGLFYFAGISLIIFLVYRTMTATPPTCFDTIQNQDETGVDCGGVCVACDIKDLSPLAVIGSARIFSVPTLNKQAVLFEVQNPNSTYHAAQFTYTLTVTDKTGATVESWSGTDTLFAGEHRFMFDSRVITPARTIGNIAVTLSDPQWELATERVPPSLSLSDIQTATSSGLGVSGVIKNASTFSAPNVKLIAILRTKSGIELFASQVILTSVPGFASSTFTIPLPSDTTLIDNLDPASTEVFASSK